MINKLWQTCTEQNLRDLSNRQDQEGTIGLDVSHGVLGWITNFEGRILNPHVKNRTVHSGRGTYKGAGNPDGKGKGYG